MRERLLAALASRSHACRDMYPIAWSATALVDVARPIPGMLVSVADGEAREPRPELARRPVIAANEFNEAATSNSGTSGQTRRKQP